MFVSLCVTCNLFHPNERKTGLFQLCLDGNNMSQLGDKHSDRVVFHVYNSSKFNLLPKAKTNCDDL